MNYIVSGQDQPESRLLKHCEERVYKLVNCAVAGAIFFQTIAYGAEKAVLTPEPHIPERIDEVRPASLPVVTAGTATTSGTATSSLIRRVTENGIPKDQISSEAGWLTIEFRDGELRAYASR